MRMRTYSKQNNIRFIYWIGIYIAIFIFFYRIHPMILFDTDDWLYCYAARNMYPQIGAWNPARVLPEVLMPLISYISAYLIYPISGDYIMSLAFGYAIILTTLIVIYFHLAYRLLRQRMQISEPQAMAVTVLFIILHFLIYRTYAANNEHIFYSANVTCVFYYIIPTLLNVILILYFEFRGQVFVAERALQNGGVLLLIWLAIYSNLFNSCLLPIWCGVQLLARWIRRKRDGVGSLKENIGLLLVIVLWLTSMVYELTGDRASSVNQQFSITSLIECAVIFTRRYLELNHMTALVILFCVLLQIVCMIRGKRQYLRAVMKMAAIFFIAALYLVLLCTKVGKGYLGSTTYINTTIVLLLFVYYSLGICVKEYEEACVFAPLIAGILFCNINTNGNAGTFKDCDWINDNKYAYQCSTYLVNTIKSAEAGGVTSLEIAVPRVGEGSNWPLVTTYGGERVRTALYKHGVIGTWVDVTLVVDENMNLADLYQTLDTTAGE